MRRIVLAVAAALAFALGMGENLPARAQADKFPSKPVTLIIPWPAGGPTDIVMRAMAQRAEKELGQPIIIENKAGASGSLGPATMAAAAKPDGYTIAQIPISIFRLPLMQKASWDAEKDFTYIVHTSGYVFAMSVAGTSPHKTWADIVAFAKANPGKVTYSTPGAATSLHIGMEQIAAHEGMKLVQVPFKGQAEQTAALLGGHTMMMAGGGISADLVSTGQVRVLGLWSEKRSPRYPDTPTLKELGMPFVFDSPFGIGGPKGMDPAIVKRLHDAFKATVEDPAVVEVMMKHEIMPRYLGTAAYTAYAKELIAKEREFLDRLGLIKK